jgi:hypothetical protein
VSSCKYAIGTRAGYRYAQSNCMYAVLEYRNATTDLNLACLAMAMACTPRALSNVDHRMAHVLPSAMVWLLALRIGIVRLDVVGV